MATASIKQRDRAKEFIKKVNKSSKYKIEWHTDKRMLLSTNNILVQVLFNYDGVYITASKFDSKGNKIKSFDKKHYPLMNPTIIDINSILTNHGM